MEKIIGKQQKDNEFHDIDKPVALCISRTVYERSRIDTIVSLRNE